MNGRRRYRRRGEAQDTLTNDSSVRQELRDRYPAVKLAEPSIAFAIEAKSRQDEDRMGHASTKSSRRINSLRFYRDSADQGFPAAAKDNSMSKFIVSG